MKSNFSQLFLASEDAFFTSLECRIAELEGRLFECEGQIENYAAICERLSAHALAAMTRGPAPTAWSYDVRMPNIYFDDVFDIEWSDGDAKRWVGAGNALKGQLLLDRRHQYRVNVEIVNFVSAEAESSFSISVGNTDLPWLEMSERIYSTIIPEAANESILAFRIGVSNESRSAEKDVSFSFRKLEFIQLR
ncbi:MAG: hypothetical protein IPK78_20470 [Rhodospirillales bacterium]|nr:hypothetical protein [Rhodospirillales bacterium]